MVVSHKASERLAAAIERQRNIGERKIAGQGRRTRFDETTDALAAAIKRATGKDRAD